MEKRKDKNPGKEGFEDEETKDWGNEKRKKKKDRENEELTNGSNANKLESI